jgi:hypothetical protein
MFNWAEELGVKGLYVIVVVHGQERKRARGKVVF